MPASTGGLMRSSCPSGPNPRSAWSSPPKAIPAVIRKEWKSRASTPWTPLPDTKVFQAGTKREGSRTLSSGGRVLCVTALGKGLAEAQKRAYEAVAKIDMEKSQHRSDIGAKGLRRL